MGIRVLEACNLQDKESVNVLVLALMHDLSVESEANLLEYSIMVQLLRIIARMRRRMAG